MFTGFSNISLHKLFILDTNSKGTRGHARKLVKTRCTRDITKYFSSKVINRSWMHTASMHLSLDRAISETTGWAFSGF